MQQLKQRSVWQHVCRLMGALGVGAGISIGISMGAAAAPNIIYILADDMGQGDTTAYNPESKIPTPNLQRLADEGMIFTNMHTNSSVCTPTRYGVLTGRYAWRTHLKSGVLGGYSQHLIDPARETVASFLQKQGYATAMIGKWHLGMDFASTDGKPVNAKGVTRGNNGDMKAPIKNGPNANGSMGRPACTMASPQS